jgi:hypothetical protein
VFKEAYITASSKAYSVGYNPNEKIGKQSLLKNTIKIRAICFSDDNIFHSDIRV